MNIMTKQRYISTSIWDDDWFDSLSEREKLVYFYLLTNTRTNIAGVYQCTLKNMRLEIGLDREEAERIMGKFAADGKAFYFKDYIIVPKWLKHQKIGERSKLFIGAVKILKSLPDDIKDFISDRRHYDYDISEIIGPNNDSLSIAYAQNGENSAHDSDLDSDLDLDSDFDPVPEISFGSDEPGGEKPAVEKQAKPKKPPLREREPENGLEHVEKAYLRNWDSLFAQGRVKTADPLINWSQTRALLKRLFESLKPEQIVSALDKAANDSFVLSGGYSLAVILSAGVLNRLINAGTGPPKHRIEADNIPPDKIHEYFKGA